MRSFRHTPPRDRRAARLVGLATQSTTRPAALESSGLEALARVLAAYDPARLAGRGDARETDRALRAAVRRLAAEARAQDPVRGERLVLDLKRAWPTLPGAGSLSRCGADRALWDRLVALCCEEFYAGSRPAAVPAQPRTAA